MLPTNCELSQSRGMNTQSVSIAHIENQSRPVMWALTEGTNRGRHVHMLIFPTQTILIALVAGQLCNTSDNLVSWNVPWLMMTEQGITFSWVGLLSGKSTQRLTELERTSVKENRLHSSDFTPLMYTLKQYHSGIISVWILIKWHVSIKIKTGMLIQWNQVILQFLYLVVLISAPGALQCDPGAAHMVLTEAQGDLFSTWRALLPDVTSVSFVT